MNLIRDESGQAGTIIFIIIGLFIAGLSYVMLGPVMDENQKANNDLINSSTLTYTQDRADMMTGIYDNFKYYPLYMLLLFVVYGIKKSIDKQSGEI
jgi:hypothetical protein